MLSFKPSISAVLLAVLSFWFVTSANANEIQSIEMPKSNLTLEIEFSTEQSKVYKDRLISLVDMYIYEASKLFGGLPKKLDGSFYTRLHLKLTSNGFGGEADPEFIELRGIGDRKLFGFYNWEIVLLHEVLHLWSAETFLYADDQEQWFNEGVTEYITFRLAAKLGVLKKDQVLNAFSKPIGNYLSAKGIGEHSLRSVGKTSELKKAHYFLLYHGGFVAGMILDHQIRSRSNGKFTIDDLMRGLYKTHSRDNRYSSDSVLKLINTNMNIDFSAFFERYIDGNEIMPVGNYFDMGQLMLSEIGASIEGSNQKYLAEMLMLE